MVSPISKHFQLLSSMKRFAWISGIVMLCYVGENGQLRTSTWIIIVQTPWKVYIYAQLMRWDLVWKTKYEQKTSQTGVRVVGNSLDINTRLITSRELSRDLMSWIQCARFVTCRIKAEQVNWNRHHIIFTQAATLRITVQSHSIWTRQIALSATPQ